VIMTSRNQAILILSGGILFLILGIWWLTIPGMQNGAFGWLIGAAVFIVGGMLKLKQNSRK
jgi:uncharacterized membrane protein HdeD (DUF308 family)